MNISCNPCNENFWNSYHIFLSQCTTRSYGYMCQKKVFFKNLVLILEMVVLERFWWRHSRFDPQFHFLWNFHQRCASLLPWCLNSLTTIYLWLKNYVSKGHFIRPSGSVYHDYPNYLKSCLMALKEIEFWSSWLKLTFMYSIINQVHHYF